MHSNSVQGLGISFYNGDLWCLQTFRNGRIGNGTLRTRPSTGPNLRVLSTRALEQSDLVLADSGLLCLWKNGFKTRSFPNLRPYLQEILNRLDWKEGSTFWIMPDKKQADANVIWLEETYGPK